MQATRCWGSREQKLGAIAKKLTQLLKESDMASKLSPSFTMASELAEPDAVYCVGISHRECHGVLSLIKREPLRFLPEQWLARDEIDPEILAMLPKGKASLDQRTLMELEDWFGPRGRFPALMIGNV